VVTPGDARNDDDEDGIMMKRSSGRRTREDAEQQHVE